LLDFVLAGNNVVMNNDRTIATLLSDHSIILMNLDVAKPFVSNGKQMITNKKAMLEITERAIREAQNSCSFFRKIDRQMKKRKYNILKKIKPQRRKNELLDSILKVKEEDEDLDLIIKEYRGKLMEENELQRSSKFPEDIRKA